MGANFSLFMGQFSTKELQTTKINLLASLGGPKDYLHEIFTRKTVSEEGPECSFAPERVMLYGNITM